VGDLFLNDTGNVAYNCDKYEIAAELLKVEKHHFP
jgi:hypothetical protein